MSNKPWDGRFAERTDKMVEAFTASIDIDRQLFTYDIEGSSAHALMLGKVGVITEEEASQLVQGLGGIKREIERGKFMYDDSLEDIHMHIEARLLQQVGKVALKLHTARSRNDQIALDIRMYLRDQTKTTIALIDKLRQVLVDMAQMHIEVVMPGYTHLQRAQPVLFSHHLMAYYEMLTRDGARFCDVLKRIDVMPLGSAALAGTPYPIDREYTAELLGFERVSKNSIDAVSDRDFIIEFVAAASLCMMHLSRLSEEVILWSSTEFGFIELPDAFATGSSIMPQKKNPDVAELVRGKTGRVYGELMALLTIMKSLPLAYNRDMQEDKEPLFNTVAILTRSLGIYTLMLPKVKIKAEVMAAAVAKGFLNATDMADYLVSKGMAFREAHECVGQAVTLALKSGKELHDLTLKELKGVASLIDEDIFDMLTIEKMIERRRCTGATATECVVAAISAAEKDLKQSGASEGAKKG
jgi:argininosuccinate lyase